MNEPPSGRWVVGVDLSTTRIDVAAIPLDASRGGLVFATYGVDNRRPLDLARRCASAGHALGDALGAIQQTYAILVAAVAVEDPIGAHRSADRALLPILGALTMAADPHPVAWYQPNAWRALIGCQGVAVRTKAGGHARLMELYGADLAGLDEHALDAFGVALAHRTNITREAPP